MVDSLEHGSSTPMIPETQGGDTARVTAVMRERYELMTADGTAFGRLKGGAYYYENPEEYPTVGDYVQLQEQDLDGDRLIVRTLPRFSQFMRLDSYTKRRGYQKAIHAQAVAANFDVCFVVTSMNHDLNPARLERYLSQAWASGATPAVILTKADLVDDYSSIIESVRDVTAGVDVIAASSHTGMGLNTIREILQPGKTAVLLGSSGVGKSSIVNALMDVDIMRVNAIREDDSRGRHTTTHRQMIHLPWGAMIIDTPGMRELGMWDAEDGLTTAFPDVEGILSRGCKFSNCRHDREPGCAIHEAIRSGELPAERWESFNNLRKESRFAQDKLAFMRDKSRRNKQIAIFARSRKNI